MDPTELTPEALAAIRNSYQQQQPQVTLQPVDHDPFVDPMSGANVGQMQPLGNAMIGVGRGLAQQAMTPGAQMKPNPYPPGSEEAQWYDNQKADQANQWAPAMATNMIGVGGPAAMLGPEGAIGAAGGRATKTGFDALEQARFEAEQRHIIDNLPPPKTQQQKLLEETKGQDTGDILNSDRLWSMARDLQAQRSARLGFDIPFTKAFSEVAEPLLGRQLTPEELTSVGAGAARHGIGVTLGSGNRKAAAPIAAVADLRNGAYDAAYGPSDTIQEGGSGARAAQGGPAPAGAGAPNLGGQEAGPQAVAGAARRAGGVGGVDLQPADPQAFQKAIAAAKMAHPQGASVTLYPDYSGMKTFLTPDQKAGFALNGNDIVSVFRHPDGPRGVVGPILDRAVAEGGQRLDAFDTALPHLYGDHGFRAVARTPFNEEFAPEGWQLSDYKKYNNGRPDVVAMVHDPAYGKSYQAGDGAMHPDYDSMIAAQKDAAHRDSPLGNAPFPQYAENYPPVGPGRPMINEQGKPYTEKVLTPEAEEFKGARADIVEDMKKNGFQPFFDPSQRFHVNPENYPGQFDTSSVLPAKQETIDKYLQTIGAEETRQRLRNAYSKGLESPGDPQHWYAMGQLENNFVNNFGPEKGRQMFRDQFATSMAATTGGADPEANLLMSGYANYMRNKGQPMPTDVGADGKVKIASHQLPFPVGGRYVGGNMKTYNKIMDEGGFSALGEDNPKRADFANAFMGNPKSFTWDEQMTSGATPGVAMPPKGTYGLYEGMGREEAARAGVDPQNYQDVAWAGFKNQKKPYTSQPMIQNVNEMIERTHRLTGMPRSEIMRRWGQIPQYGIAGLAPALSAAVARRQSEEQ